MPKVLAISTDASFRVPGDGRENDSDYYSLDAVIDACNDKNIKVFEV